MPDQEVLINDSNLNAIANAIRRKNGLVRTYKPREMAPAIRAINADAPDSREYTVTVIQTPHQTIKVRQVLGGEKQYNQSFTVSEPYWKIQATIEPEAGYTAGALNYPNEVTVNRDITIKATPATEIVVPPNIETRLYWQGTIRDSWHDSRTAGLSLDRDVEVNYSTRFSTIDSIIYRPESRKVYYIYPMKDQVPLWMFRLFNVYSYSDRVTGDRSATDIVIDLENKIGLITIQDVIGESPWLEYVQFNNWDTSEVESILSLVKNCERLKSIGDISHWDTSSLQSIDTILQGNQYLDSLDLSGWATPRLNSATNIFPRGRILDISNWDTTNISNFSAGISAKTKVGVLYPAYLIMDKEEVKFSGNYIFSNIANCKYLVPEDMVDAYKQHPNWQSRASQIESITNYTINRGDGQVKVVPNW